MAVIKRLLLLAWLSCAVPAAAQPPAPAPAPPASQPPQGQPSVIESGLADWRQYFGSDQNDSYYFGHVELKRNDVQMCADEGWFNQKGDLVYASGSVLFSQGKNQIAAEYAELNRKTNFGTFYNASGIATVQRQKQTAQPGAIAVPQMIGQENVVYFFGD